MSEETGLTKAASLPVRVRKYVDELRDEMRLVTWPSSKQVRATTGVVIASVFVFAAYFALVDEIFGRAIQSIFDAFAA